MFCPLKITIGEVTRLVQGHQISRDYLGIYNRCDSHLQENVSQRIVGEHLINGTRLQERWFPNNMPFDVFLSHSHQDIESVKKFASWMYDNLGLTCFVDSLFWLYSDDLQRGLDDRFCLDKREREYNYEARNIISSNVHAMLNMALMEMMDRTECIIFIGSENSLQFNEDDRTATCSPWIYEEISFAQKLRKNVPQRYSQKYGYEILNENLQQRTFSAQTPNFRYDVDIRNMKILTSYILNSVTGNGYTDKEALDAIYNEAGASKRFLHG